jgi:hypothetical protein
MPFILCRVVWANTYRSKKESFFAGNMKYPMNHGVAHELLNFANEAGLSYGYVESKGDSIRLSNFGIATNAETIDGITIIWCALDEGTRKLRVVGWYDDATVFSRPQALTGRSLRGRWQYYFKTKIENAHLIAEAERYLEVPMKSKIEDRGYIGQRNWFFPTHSDRYIAFLESFALMKKPQDKARPTDQLDRSAFEEGQRLISEVTVSVRNPKLVAAAKAHYGFRCQVCDFSFEEKYGGLGKGFIEVHHLIPLAANQNRRANTVEDVRVLCANCHRMIHRKAKSIGLDELKRQLK